MANQESTTRTLLVALVVCLVSSVFVAGAAVALKPTQAENRLLDKQRSILAIAGLGEPGMSGKEVKALFDSRITAKVVDLQSGTFSDAQDPLGYDPLKAARTRRCRMRCPPPRTSPRSSAASAIPRSTWWRPTASSTP